MFCVYVLCRMIILFFLSAQLKVEMMTTLLDRKINIGARDADGFTARDYLESHDCDVNKQLMQMIDEHLIHKVYKLIKCYL